MIFAPLHKHTEEFKFLHCLAVETLVQIRCSLPILFNIIFLHSDTTNNTITAINLGINECDQN